jgi:cell wall assembly regulator SMI1
MSFDPQRFDRAWARYVAAIAASKADFGDLFAAGAPSGDIEDAERAIGVKFPADLRHLLAKHDGAEGGVFVLPGWELFPAVQIVEEYKVWEELRREQFNPDGMDCEPEGPIKGDEWWRLGWIPFCGDGGGNHLCVDMDPAEGGTVGQVITMWHDDGLREMISPSLTEFVELIAEDAEAGDLLWDENWGGVYSPVDADEGEDGEEDLDEDADGDSDD